MPLASQDTLDIFGSQGSIHVSSLNQGIIRFKTSNGERVETLPPAANFHQPLIDDFTQAVLDGRDPTGQRRSGPRVATMEAEIYRWS
jgi:hypothetical protein